jgi:hypothetical protein
VTQGLSALQARLVGNCAGFEERQSTVELQVLVRNKDMDTLPQWMNTNQLIPVAMASKPRSQMEFCLRQAVGDSDIPLVLEFFLSQMQLMEDQALELCLSQTVGDSDTPLVSDFFWSQIQLMEDQALGFCLRQAVGVVDVPLTESLEEPISSTAGLCSSAGRSLSSLVIASN